MKESQKFLDFKIALKQLCLDHEVGLYAGDYAIDVYDCKDGGHPFDCVFLRDNLKFTEK